MEEEEED